MPRALTIKDAQDVSIGIQRNTGVWIPPEFFLRHWEHETGNFTSELYRDGFNPGGFTTTTDKGAEWKQPDGGNWYIPFSSIEHAKQYMIHYYPLYFEDGMDKARTYRDFVLALKHGGYFTDSVENYMGEGGNFTGSGALSKAFTTFSLLDNMDKEQNEWNKKQSLVMGSGQFVPQASQQQQQQHSMWDEFWDKAKDAWIDDGSASLLRTAFTHLTTDPLNIFSSYTPNKDDMELIDTALPLYTQNEKGEKVEIPGVKEAREYVLEHATSHDDMMELMKMKREDLERRARVEDYDYGITTIGTVLGNVLSPDTIAALLLEGATSGGATPVVGAEIASKVTKATKLFSAMNKMKKALRYSKYLGKAIENPLTQVAMKSAAGSMTFLGDRWLAKNYGGFQVDYGSAGVLGATLGGVAGTLRHLDNLAPKLAGTDKAKDIIRVTSKIKEAERHAVEQAMDIPSTLSPKFRMVQKLSKYEDIPQIKEGSIAHKALSEGKVFVLKKADAEKVFNVKIPDDAKAFTDKHTNIAVLIKEKVNSDNIDGLVAHEVGVHQGLKNIIGEDNYKEIMDAVKKRMQHSTSPEWLNATRKGDTPEEVLAYYAEEAFKNNDSIWKKIKDVVKKDESLGNITDKQLKDLIKDSIEESKKVITKYEDGSFDIADLHYSKDNLAKHWFEQGFETPEEIAQEQQMKTFTVAGHKFTPEAMWEGNPVTGSLYGVAHTSPIKEARGLGAMLAVDPVLRKREIKIGGKIAVPVETMKSNMTNEMLIPLNRYLNLRQDYIKKNMSIIQRFGNEAKEALNRQAIECADIIEKGGTPPPNIYKKEVVEMAKQLVDFRKIELKLGATSPEKLGGAKNLLPFINNIENINVDGFYRWVDTDKLYTYITRHFKSKEEAVEMFTDYAERAVDKEKIKEKLFKERNEKFQKELEEFQKSNRLINVMRKPPEKPTDISAEELEDYIHEQANKWAYGIIDRNKSNPRYLYSKSGIKEFEAFKWRFPMNTNFEMDIGNGITFCFNRDARSYDIDNILPQRINRMSGEYALHAAFGKDGLKERMQDIALKCSKYEKQLGKQETGRTLEALERMIDKIRGVGNYDITDMNSMRLLTNLLRKWTYSTVGGNMGFNQMGEIGGAVAYGGFKTLGTYLPIIGETISRMQRKMSNKELAEFAEEAHSLLYAQKLETMIWHRTSSNSYKAFKEAFKDHSFIGNILAKADKWANETKRVVDTVNQMQQLTEAQIKAVRISTLMDAVEWSKGKEFTKFRNPFSLDKLSASGITEEMIPALKENIKKYFKASEKATLEENLEKWKTKDPMSFYKFRELVDNQSRRAITQGGIGADSYLEDKNMLTKLVTQFKAFTFQALHGQTLRAIKHHEAEDYFSLLFNMGMATLTYAVLERLKAEGMFGDDDKKKKEYLNKRLDVANLAGVAFSRPAMASPVSFYTDLKQIYTGNNMYRTTVDNSYNARYNNTDEIPTATDLLYRAMTQVPALSQLDKGMRGTQSLYSLMTAQGDQRDIDNFVRTLPLSTWVGMTYMTGLIHSATKDTIPKQKKKKKETTRKTYTRNKTSAIDSILGK